MPAVPKPNLFQRAVIRSLRTLFVTLLFTIFGMAVGLLAGILWYVIAGAARGIHPDMTLAYRNVAIHVAIVFGACALLYQLFLERRTAPRPRS